MYVYLNIYIYICIYTYICVRLVVKALFPELGLLRQFQ